MTTRDLMSLYPLLRLVLLRDDHSLALRLMFFLDVVGVSIHAINLKGGHLTLSFIFSKIELSINFSYYDSLSEDA